ncbi:hypothetical protein H257_13586 [Aphanomyces astaci]|uniref:Uncharacterized protein n=1 Tax=Aphanomyces astaci TaxID=112090 RepID=W4FWN8_APHAT|nr:hypothetical protein H257_13586 [Aphanomyces astaci]ETV71204.1 hypothetical protein H257_13586 [Aphanomyces astaci]|eukprot:XP_009839450.1 hypothetical protein H257_13586 [Aphanomyces astaci]
MVAASGGVDVSTEAAGTGLTRFDIPRQYTDVALTPDTAHTMVAASGGVDVSTEAAGTGLTGFDIPGQYTDVALTPDTAHSVDGSSSLNGMLYFVPPDSFAKIENELAEHCRRYQRRVHRDPKVVYIYRHSIHRQQAVQYLEDAYIIHALALGSNGYKEAVSTHESRNAKAKTYVHPPLAIKDGLRHCPAKTFHGLVAKDRPNYRLVTSAVVSHIRHIDGKAASVMYTLGDASMSASATLTPSVIGPTSQQGLVGGKSQFPGVATNQSSWMVNENVGTTYLHGRSPAHAKPSRYGVQAYCPQRRAYNTSSEYQFQVTRLSHAEPARDDCVLEQSQVTRQKGGFTRQPDMSRHADMDKGLYFSSAGDGDALGAY